MNSVDVFVIKGFTVNKNVKYNLGSAPHHICPKCVGFSLVWVEMP